VTTEREIEELLDIRKRSKTVVAMGICATLGGIQGRFLDEKEWRREYEKVYGNVEMTHTKAVPSKPIDAYVKVDYYLPGCPISKEQFLHLFTRITRGSLPESYPQPVCVSCKYHENDCLLNRGILCLGPLTADGCGSVCINHNLPCVGCWGPVEGANYTSEYNLLIEKGFDVELIKKRMANYSGASFAKFINQLKKELK
jgi:sulfhydrogenase subunit delta